jgi:diguanylate cyclase (GGDEF)-like protein
MPEPDRDLHKYDRQLKKGFKSLTFTGDLESEFRTFFHTRNVVKQRGAILVGILLLLILVPLDMSYLQGETRRFYLISRLWITIPILVVALVFTFRIRFQRYFSVFSFFILSFIGITTNIFVIYSRKVGIYSPYEGTILIIMVAFFLGGMRFRQSLSCIIIIALSYMILSSTFLPPDQFRLHRYFFIFATCLIGGVSAYTLEYQVRIAFLQRGALKSLAKTDPLTSLYNRGALNQKLNSLVEYAYREQKPLTLLLVDIDYFKNFNDFYGHIKGDNCLIQVAHALEKNCQRPLDFAGRYGGEEFLLMWFDASPNEAKSFAEKTKTSIDTLNIPHEKSQAHTCVTLSGGMVTGIPTRQDMAEAMLHQADQCLYRAKESGRNRIIIQDLGEENSISGLVK